MRAKKRRKRHRATQLKEQQKADDESGVNQKERQKMLNAVPFGIKAFEAGVEVKGVWISWPDPALEKPSPYTPTSTLVPSPGWDTNGWDGKYTIPQLDGPSRPRTFRSARSSLSTISHLEIPQPAHTKSFDHSKGKQPAPHHQDDPIAESDVIKTGSPDPTSSMRGKPAYQPHGCHQAKLSGLSGTSVQRQSGVSTGSNGETLAAYLSLFPASHRAQSVEPAPMVFIH